MASEVIDTSLWGITDKGFYRPTIQDIIAAKNKRAKELFGEDFDTSEQTPQGKFFRVNAAAESKLLEIAEQVYYSFNPMTATGISLDRVCAGINLKRDPAGYASHIIRVYGTRDYTVPAATLFRNSFGVEFYSTADAVLSNEEEAEDATLYYADVTVYCTESGTVGNVDNITETVEVNTNITRVSYISMAAEGTEIESDPDLREKYKVVVQGLGTNTEAAIKANVLRVSGVNDVIIIDNPTTSPVVISPDLTIAARSYGVIVYTDDMNRAAEIAEAIREKMPLGIVQSGNVTETVTDNSGVDVDVKFTFVTANSLTINLSCNVNSDFSSTGEDDIKDNITSYINSLGIGEEVVYSRLYDYVYNVEGVHKVTAMTINGGTADIPINQIQVAKVGSITVTTTEV